MGKEQWARIADVMAANKLIPYFDCAYQGFATGDLNADAYAVRLFESRGFEFLLSQSFAKNLGLYCERAGCASVITSSVEASKACMTQLCGIVRPMYSNPPAHGARIVKAVLGNAGDAEGAAGQCGEAQDARDVEPYHGSDWNVHLYGAHCVAVECDDG